MKVLNNGVKSLSKNENTQDQYSNMMSRFWKFLRLMDYQGIEDYQKDYPDGGVPIEKETIKTFFLYLSMPRGNILKIGDTEFQTLGLGIGMITKGRFCHSRLRK
eukprot:UN02268